MLTASKDHLLFGPVFTDFEDLDGDGVIDTTFKPDFKYYGYFDSTKCYDYSGGQFNPAAKAGQKARSPSAGPAALAAAEAVRRGAG